MTDYLDLRDLAAERMFLGAVWYSGGRAIADSEVTAEDFTHLPHERLWQAFLDMNAKGAPFDIGAIGTHLGGDLDRVKPALMEVITSGVMPTSAEWHAKTLMRLTAHRRAVEVGQRLQQYANGEHDVEELAEFARSQVDTAMALRGAGPVDTWSDQLDRALERWTTPARDAVPTGWHDLDDLLSGGGLRPGHLTVIGARPGVGKALALDTPIATPSGWTTMGEVRVGDSVIGVDGRPTTVVAATGVMTSRPCYEMEFSDGEVIIADAHHQWLTTTRAARRAATAPRCYVFNRESPLSHDQRWKSERPSIKTTEEIAHTVRVGSDDRANHSIPAAAPMILPPHDLLVDPYVLGYWLGDGTTIFADVTIADDDVPHLTGHLDRIGYFYKKSRTNTATRLRISTRPVASGGPVGRDSLAGRLRTIGVLGNKHIPDEYLRSSFEQRAALLAGLLDSDGTANKSGRVSLALTDRHLSHQALELVRSLGHVAYMGTKRVNGRTEDRSICYTIGFVAAENPFHLPRKAARVQSRSTRAATRYIVDVRPIPSVPVRCIQVDSRDHMYLAGRSMIPTHNSLVATMLAGYTAAGGCGVYFASAEMSADELVDRVAAASSGVNLRDLTNGTISETDMATMRKAVNRIRRWSLTIDDHASTVAHVLRGARNKTRTPGGLGLVIIDYLQLFEAANTGKAPRHEVVAGMSRAFKLMSKALGVPVVLLSQLNRMSTQRENHRPLISDLRESGAVEQDADEIILLHRDDDDPDLAGQIQLHMAKNRHASTGTINLRWEPYISRITNLPTFGARLNASTMSNGMSQTVNPDSQDFDRAQIAGSGIQRSTPSEDRYYPEHDTHVEAPAEDDDGGADGYGEIDF